ncbi:unnamed protein product [Brassica rapa]|uniref:Uncharacterized protein n=1 Tax=Brassica campestris TaxID=3711 RepID=A0A8D9H8D4_BRACM|nr:unnamed protein product [Brassica rapa]
MENIKFKEFRQQFRHNGRLVCLLCSLHVYICFGILFQLLYMVMMNCLLQICQRKRLKGIISLSRRPFSILLW